jgi:hypothetical protein
MALGVATVDIYTLSLPYLAAQNLLYRYPRNHYNSFIIKGFDEEACLQQAYEAMLKASLGFMFSHGLRARSQPGHHIAIIEFVRSRIDKKNAGLLAGL